MNGPGGSAAREYLAKKLKKTETEIETEKQNLRYRS